MLYFSGEIYIDNVNISQLELEELREHLVIIPQQPFLFRNSIKNVYFSLCFFSIKTINTYLNLEIRVASREFLSFKYVVIVF